MSKLIKQYTKEPLNHASIAFDADLQEVYSFGRKSPGNPFLGGFVREDVYSPFFHASFCAVYSCRVPVKAYNLIRDQIREFEQNQERYKYNLIGLLGILLQVQMERENSFFCSQFVARVFESGGIKLIDKPSQMVTPGDLRQTEFLEFIYSGKLHAYLGQQPSLDARVIQPA